jgi:hypothetical protein
MDTLTESQIKIVKEQAWLEARASIVRNLLHFGILETRNDIAGFWANIGGTPTWVSVYDILEQNRD